jgi:hypothetical protein
MESIFLLVKYFNVTYLDAYKMPIWKREWFLNRIIKENEKKNSNNK